MYFRIIIKVLKFCLTERKNFYFEGMSYMKMTRQRDHDNIILFQTHFVFFNYKESLKPLLLLWHSTENKIWLPI